MTQFPEFIQNAIDTRNTSLGNNGIFHGNNVGITSSLLKERMEQVMHGVIETFGYIPTIDEAKTRLSKLLKETIKEEEPLKNQLENLCNATVNYILGVPQETILVNCELVDKIQPYMELRIRPEILDKEVRIAFNDELLKRRAINSLVEGISYLLMTATYDSDELQKWSPKLPKLYDEIIKLNDFLLFSEKEKITDENPMLGAHVETDIGGDEDKTVINAQGLVYPLLLQETYRGFFELFASHGLPNDKNEAMNIIKLADITIADAWDLRIGVPMWQDIDKLLKNDIEPSIYPYLFSSIAELDCNEFNDLMYNVFKHDNEAKKWLNDIVMQVEQDEEYQFFKANTKKFNLDSCLINDEEQTENIISEE